MDQRVVVGIGARADVGAESVVRVISDVMQPNWTVVAVASIDRRAGLVTALASSMGVQAVTYSAAELSGVATTTASSRVRDAVGSASVAEAAALLAGEARDLLTPRIIHGGVTVAVALAARNGAG